MRVRRRCGPRIVIVGLAGALLGCAERSVEGGGTSGGSETGATLGHGDTGSSASVPEPTGGGTTTATTGALGGETGGTDTGGVDAGTTDGFIIHPDYDSPGGLRCDVFKQDCAPGEKCTAWAEGGGGAWNATKCVEVTGDGQPGESCTTVGDGVSGIDDCAKGVMCWDVDARNMGTCVALCTGSPQAPICQGMTICAQSGPLNLCLPYCDPLIQDCPDGESCIPSGDTFLCLDDVSGNMGEANDPCEFANGCDPGLVCLNTADASAACMQGATGCCQPFCEFVEGQDGDCPNPDQKCVSWFDPMHQIPMGSEDVGVCAVPQ